MLGSVELFDLDGVRTGRFGLDDEMTGAAFSPDGAWLATTAVNGCLRVWDTATGECATVIVVDGALRDCAWFPDGSGLCAVGKPGLFGFTFHR
ncbi:WD40 repeat domain-containing protein [Nonomuraea antimicrobica]